VGECGESGECGECGECERPRRAASCLHIHRPSPHPPVSRGVESFLKPFKTFKIHTLVQHGGTLDNRDELPVSAKIKPPHVSRCIGAHVTPSYPFTPPSMLVHSGYLMRVEDLPIGAFFSHHPRRVFEGRSRLEGIRPTSSSLPTPSSQH